MSKFLLTGKEGSRGSIRSRSASFTGENESRGDLLEEAPVESKFTEVPEVEKIGKGLEEKVENMFNLARVVFEEYASELKNSSLVDFIHNKNQASIRVDCETVGRAVEAVEKVSRTVNKTLKDFRKELTALHEAMQNKFEEEQMESWYPPGETPESEALQEERVAAQKNAIAQLTELKLSSARAAHEVAESHLRVSKAEEEAAEAEAQARKAREMAEDALKSATKAKLAAEEKKKREEEIRLRENELRRMRLEQEARKKEDEERKLRELAEAEGRSIDELREKEREMKEKVEAYKKDPANWSSYLLQCEQMDFKPPVAMIVRAFPGTLRGSDIQVRQIDNTSGLLRLIENEELISNILELEPVNPDFHPKTDEPLSILIPHCAPRTLIGREPVVKMLQGNGEWVELPSQEVTLEQANCRLVEGRSRRFGMFAAVLRQKREKLSFSRRGDRQVCECDHRVSFTALPGAVAYTTFFTVDVQHFEPNHGDEVRANQQETDCTGLISCSPMVRIHMNNNTMSQPVTITLPCPSAASVKSGKDKPTSHHLTATAQAKKKKSLAPTVEEGGTPLISFDARKSVGPEDDTPSNDALMLLCWNSHDKKWVALPDIAISFNKKIEVASFDTTTMYERFIILRLLTEVRPNLAEKIAAAVEAQVYMRSVKAFLKQRYDDPHECAFGCVPADREEKETNYLRKEGYIDGPAFSEPHQIKEGQLCDIQTKGNITRTSGDIRSRFAFHSNINVHLMFRCDEIDPYAQKGFDTYMGHIQLYSKGIVMKFVGDDPVVRAGGRRRSTSSARGSITSSSFKSIPGNILLAELVVTLPKGLHEPHLVRQQQLFALPADGPIQVGMLRSMARDLVDIDMQSLAASLHLTDARLEAIRLSHTCGDSKIDIITDLLISWVKRQPRGADKLDMLVTAMLHLKKTELAEKLRKRNYEFKKQKAYDARVSHLTKAFVIVARNPEVLENWKSFAEMMGLSAEEINELESLPTTQDKVIGTLKAWHKMKGNTVTTAALASQLKICKFRALARQVEASH